MTALELAQEIDDGGTVDQVLGAIAGEPLERPAEAHDRHGGIVAAARRGPASGEGPPTRVGRA